MTNPAVPGQSLPADYEARIAADLESNREGHQRVTQQMAELAAELKTLEQNRDILLSMQGVFKGKDSAKGAAEPTKADGPSKTKARKKTTATVPAVRKAHASKTGAGSKGPGKRAQGADGSAGPREPSLVQLVRKDLSGEPRTAAEVQQAVSAQHPDRSISVNATRTSLEALVAKGTAQRSRQGRAVFYSLPATETESVSSAHESDAVAV